MNSLIIIATFLISLAIGIVVGMTIRKKIAESKIESAEQEAKRVVDLAKVEAENMKKEEIFKAKEEIMNARNELDQEIKERRGEVQKQESRIIQKEENLDRRSENLEKKVESNNTTYVTVEDTENKIETMKEKIPEIKDIKLIKENEDGTKQYVLESDKDVDLRKIVFNEFAKENITIYVGKNNLQNDYLTFKMASRNDMWFHVKDMPGSHVVVHSEELNEYTIRLASKIAAYFSKGKHSSSVPVNYTQIKTLKKPQGAKPGQVILNHYSTIYIDPDDSFLNEINKID